MILACILALIVMVIGFMVSREFDEPFNYIPIGIALVLAVITLNECLKLFV